MRNRERILIDIPTPQCHATTVCKTPVGYTLAWFGGTAEKNNDVGIYTVTLAESGLSVPQLVSKEANIPHWNPVLWLHEDGNLLLYYKTGFEIDRWETFLTESSDFGKSWSMPHPLVPGDTAGGRGPVKNKPLRLSDGTVLAPASSEQGCWRAFIDRSDDGGRHFTRTDFIEAPLCNGQTVGMIQPTLWESAPGIVHAFLRTNAGRIARSDSEDGGRHWSRAYLTELPNNNSGIDLTRIADGTLLLACNPVAGSWRERTPLVLLASHDDGAHWEQVFVLEDTPGEYSYPAIIPDGNGAALSYTWNRQKVAFWKLDF